MTWQPIVIGADASSEGALAVTLGWTVATAAQARCHVVHGVREATHPGLPGPSAERERFNQQVVAAARRSVIDAMQETVPREALERLEVRLGNPAWALARAVEETHAELLVLGGKHHSAPVRWFGGSTVHHAVRTIDVPILVAAPTDMSFSRILVATDLSDVARPTIEAAVRFAALFDSTLRVMHVVEPLPSIPDVGIELDEREHLRLAEEGIRELLAAADPAHTAELKVRSGTPARAIAEECDRWNADLVVVGTHGKGWVDRVLLGSTTERLLNRLPASVLVIPVRTASKE